jgi:predicted MFS family arabinose efflux permease
MVLLLSEEPFNFTSTTIGLFGIIGASGALAAPLVGKLSDKGSSRIAVGYGCMLIAFSFMIFYFSGSSVIGSSLG